MSWQSLDSADWLKGWPDTFEAVRDQVVSPRAQFLLYSLCRHDGKRTLARLAWDVAAFEYGQTPPASRVQKVYSRLYHHHLQQLLVAGLVEYSPADGTVSLA